MLVSICSVFFYQYTKITILNQIIKELDTRALDFIKQNNVLEIDTFEFTYPRNDDIIKITRNTQNLNKKTISQIDNYIIYSYPVKDSVITVQKNITDNLNLINEIFINTLVINMTMLGLILFYALYLSKMLLIPLKILSCKMNSLNEYFLKEINLNKTPDELMPFIKSTNNLINRIKIFSNSQKELFIGITHELKTPLAVMKTKNQVALIKQRDTEEYIQTLKTNNDSIDEITNMINSILKIGRQESYQFDKIEQIDIIAFLRNISKNFSLLLSENKKIELDLNPQILNIKIQTNLLNSIIQNYIENAIKFSNPNSVILIKSYIKENNFEILVIDEGCGIDETKNLFAPFKRYGNKNGTGLGLFLAQNAASVLGATLKISNRTDKKGTVSSMILPLK